MDDEEIGYMSERLPQVRFSVNSRCGRACFFCRQSGESLSTQASAAMSLDDIFILGTAFKAVGLTSIKLTGGDPALWDPLVDAVRILKKTLGMKPVEVISRHPSIGNRAEALSSVDTDVLNISLDTLRPECHKGITGRDDHSEILSAIDCCVQAGLDVKLNMVVMRDVNVHEVMDIVRYSERTGVRTLKLLDVIQDLDDDDESFVGRISETARLADLYTPLHIISDMLAEYVGNDGELALQGGLGHPMRKFQLPSGLCVLVKDHKAGAWYGSICQSCPSFPCHDALMALRVTADLRLQYCLLREDVAIDLRPLFQDAEALNTALRNAISVFSEATFMENREVTL